MKKLLFLFLPVFLLTCKPSAPLPEEAAAPVDYVDPFIGTAEHGHVYPGATVPFGAVQLSPDNGTQGWDWCSGYNWADSLIVGFGHLHLSGTGIGDLYDIQMMPASGEVDLTASFPDPRQAPWAAAFRHEREEATPGYYAVKLENDIRVELTAGKHLGVHRYSFPEGMPPAVVLDLGYHVNWDRPVDTYLKVENETLITGYRWSTGWARDQRVYFALQFSQPIQSFVLADSTAAREGNEVRGMKARALFRFASGQPVQARVGISSADVEGARAALTEGQDFDAVRTAAAAEWAAELSKISVVSDDEEAKKVFYTALYHTCLAPVVYSDARGSYKGVDGQVHQAQGYTRYDIFSLWDTFRAANPLYTLTQPGRVNDFIRSLLAHYDEYGMLPVWSLLGNETNTMTGYHAVPVIVDAYLKGYRDFDAEKAAAAMVKSGLQDIRGTNFYRDYSYIPYDKDGQSVTKTLEYAYDDWCIAQFGKAVGREQLYQIYQQRSENYRNLFDPVSGFMRARYTDGRWKTPFDPQFSDHNFEVAEYTEGNAWQHSWFVPHDPAGLIRLHGGNEPFVRKLDSLFTVSSEIRGENASADISGLIGQYAHGNEPSHHIAYLYNYAGAPWKTQERVREIMATQYNASAAGLCGNEDCGQMSAWYVFSAIGLYPVNPAQGVYVIGSPLFEEVRLQTPAGNVFTVRAKGASAENPYIQAARLDGQPLERSYLTHEEILRGSTLELDMGPEPAPALWSSPAAAPPSGTVPSLDR